MKTYYLLPALLMASCASSNTPPTTIDIGSAPLPQKQNASDLASVRTPEVLKAYPVGRSVDPEDPDIMHEGHIIYRAEASPDWNTAPNAPTYMPVGPDVMATADPAQQHTALTAELEQRLKQEDQLLQTTFEQNKRLGQEIIALQKSMPQLRPPEQDTPPASPPPVSVSQPTTPTAPVAPAAPVVPPETPQKSNSTPVTPKPWWNWMWPQSSTTQNKK